jgi:hypothetical protein
MRDIALDTTTHDLTFAAFDLGLVNDADRVVQQIKIRLLFFFGEWFLDTRRGVPYFEDILKKSPDRVIVEGAFREQIETTPDVQTVDELTLDYNNATRLLSVAFRVTTTFGTADGTLPISVEV